MATLRLRIDVAYDGSAFSGWASQPGRRTVQATLEAVIGTALGIPEPRLTVAGRTDAGVHARGQVCHVDVPAGSLDATGDCGRLLRRLNALVAEDLVVHAVSLAPTGFDARFSACWRRYAYRVIDDPAGVDPLQRGFWLLWPRHLDVDAMNEAAGLLVGEHDFAAYCKRRPESTTRRNLREFNWTRRDAALTGHFLADAFCHHMVRSLVGAVLAVGEGKRAAGWPRAVLDAGRRDSGVQVVPARGLTLEEVGYQDRTPQLPPSLVAPDG